MTLDEAIAHADEKAGYETECRREHGQLAGWLRELKDVRAAHAELVALKAMKDEMSLMLLREEGGMGIEYDRRKPLAWQRARELVGSNAGGEATGAALCDRSPRP